MQGFITFEDNIRKVVISAKFMGMDISVNESEQNTFEYAQDIDVVASYETTDDTIYITLANERKGFLSNIISFSGPTIRTRLLVKPSVKEIELKTINGDISIDELKLDRVYLNVTSGDIAINDCTIGLVAVKAITGDIKIDNCHIGCLEGTITTGDATVSNSLLKELNCSVITGDLKINKLSSDFLRSKLNLVTGDAKIFISGTQPVNYTSKSTRFTSNVRSNIPLIQDGFSRLDKRSLDISVVTGDINIVGMEENCEYTDNNCCGTSSQSKTAEQRAKNSGNFLTPEEQKVLKLLDEKKISFEFAVELLQELGYNKEEAVKTLNNRGYSE